MQATEVVCWLQYKLRRGGRKVEVNRTARRVVTDTGGVTKLGRAPACTTLAASALLRKAGLSFCRKLVRQPAACRRTATHRPPSARLTPLLCRV